MKKKIFMLFIMAAIAIAAGWNFIESKKEIVLTDLALANVEALAQSEGSGGIYHKYFCGGNNNYYKCTVGSGESCDGPNKPYPC